MRLWDNLRILNEQARKNTNLLQAQGIGKQIAEIETERQKLDDTERRLYTKVEEFKSKKVVIKELFSARKYGTEKISPESQLNVGMAMSRTEDKIEKMKAKPQSLEKMIDFGVLTDYTSTTSGADVEGTLQKMTVNSSVEEFAKLRTSNDKKQDQPEINEEKTVKQKTDGQEESVVAE